MPCRRPRRQVGARVGDVDHADTIEHDTALSGDDREEPVARLDAENVLGDPTVVVSVR